MIDKISKFYDYEHGISLLNNSVEFFDKSKIITNGISSVNDYNIGSLPIDYYKDVKLVKIQ